MRGGTWGNNGRNKQLSKYRRGNKCPPSGRSINYFRIRSEPQVAQLGGVRMTPAFLRPAT